MPRSILVSNLPVLHFPRYSRVNQYISSRLRRPEINENVVSQIVQKFDLDLEGKPWNLPFGRRGSNVAFLTSGGIKVVRRYRKKWEISTINYEHSILSKLAELDCPAPRLNKSADQKGLVTIGGDHYALFDFVNGKNYSSNYLIRSQKLSLIEKAAAGLADLHLCLDGFIPEGQHHLGFKDISGNRHRDLEWQRMKIVELMTQTKKVIASQDTEDLQWLLERSEKILGMLVELDSELIEEDLPHIVIHGDYGLHNILYHDSGYVIPVDFELARLEWRLSDFVISFLRFRNRKRKYDFEIMDRFIKAYNSQNAIPHEEWVLFPKVWRHLMLQFSIQYWNSYFETNYDPVRLALARDAYEQSEWAKNQSARLVNLIQ